MVESTNSQELIPLLAPQRASRLLVSTLTLYWRYPWLFLALAAAAIVPYELVAFLLTGAGSFSRGSATGSFPLSLVDVFLVSPLVAAFHVHAVAALRQGEGPQFAVIFRRGMKVLPLVVVTATIAWLGIFVGFVLLIVPGVILLLRWVVAVQAVAIENEGWSAALRRSQQLSAQRYKHVLLFLLFAGLISTTPGVVGGLAFGHHGTTAASALVGLVIGVVTAPVLALSLAMLFYDLRVRREVEARETAAKASVATGPLADPPVSAGSAAPPAPLPLDPSRDPRRYSDENRPHGWFVDPDSPKRMRYWRTAEPRGWEGKTRTPWKVRQLWPDP